MVARVGDFSCFYGVCSANPFNGLRKSLAWHIDTVGSPYLEDLYPQKITSGVLRSIWSFVVLHHSLWFKLDLCKNLNQIRYKLNYKVRFIRILFFTVVLAIVRKTLFHAVAFTFSCTVFMWVCNDQFLLKHLPQLEHLWFFCFSWTSSLCFRKSVLL